MMMEPIIYHKGSLFDAPKESLLIHSCNCKGVWGSGIAKEFAVKFPNAYADYKRICRQPYLFIIGMGFILSDNVVALLTSNGYGSYVDEPESILVNTKYAMTSLVNELEKENIQLELHAPKINSGLFKVPWEATVATIEPILEKAKRTLHVWEL